MSTGTPRDADALMRQLGARLDATVKQVVPWFLDQMPEPYFLDTDEPTRLAHLMALVAARASSDSTRLKIENQDGSEVTFIESQDRPGLLADLVSDLPKDKALTTAKVHTARDDGLVLDVFHFGNQARFDATEPEQAAKLKATLQYAHEQGRTDIGASLQAALQGAGADYVKTVPPLRLYENHLLWMQVEGTEDTVVNLSPQGRPGQLRISIATGNADPRSLFERVVTLLGRHGVDIVRAFLDPFEPEDGHPVTVLGLVVTESTCPTGDAWQPLATQLTRLRWLDARALQLHALQQDLALWEAETLVALCDLSHARLARDDAFAYARTRLLRTVRQHLPLARRVAQLFAARNRVSPRMSDEAFAAEFATLSAQIAGEVERLLDRNVLSTMLHAVQCTLRTNLNLSERYGLALRLDPAFFARSDRAEDPYGIFFVHGRGFDGFHVRFADIARGGVRVVRPRSSEQHELEAERVFEEAYDLAFAQQLKNKDIPEGGSKAVVLAEPQASVDMCVKAFANSLLDLLTPEPDVQARVLDRFGAPELLYLGPDENISPEHIVWIVQRARDRGYPLANAFMSSKPGAGINHKEFGVTSEGVTVFLEEALKSVDIDPRTQPFTVKLTGGPDGDVAGNEIRILYREFGDNAQIVAIADGSGSAQDPTGLDRQELMRLVEGSLPIADFRPEALSEQGRVLSVATAEGLRTRNTLCFEAKADAFVPAGGRPQTIHAGNWSQFLDASGQPTSRVIVEGANLFITPEARTALAKQAQVVVVKDSSANKCGVICSSYEITASMMLSPEEFLQVKPIFVAQVLDRLRVLARREAQLLFREYGRTPDTTLPKLSVTVSQTILRATEAIREGLATMPTEARAQLDDLVVAHLPPVLVEQYCDRIERLPVRYREHIIASSLATELVYREGVSFLDVPEPQIAALAVAYLDSARTAQDLAERVAQSDLPERDQIAALLRAGGGRAGLNARR